MTEGASVLASTHLRGPSRVTCRPPVSSLDLEPRVAGGKGDASTPDVDFQPLECCIKQAKEVKAAKGKKGFPSDFDTWEKLRRSIPSIPSWSNT